MICWSQIIGPAKDALRKSCKAAEVLNSWLSHQSRLPDETVPREYFIQKYSTIDLHHGSSWFRKPTEAGEGGACVVEAH